MRFNENDIYHIYNRGNNKQPVFFSDEHYLLLLKKLHRDIAPYCNILCWCLMPNHFHLMVQATNAGCLYIPAYGGKPMQILANKIGIFLSSYSQAINREFNRTGSIFQQRTKAKPVTELMQELKFSGSVEQYLISLMHYIHQNPLKAGLVSKMEDWIYSSFRDFAGFRNGRLCKKEILFRLTGYEPAIFYKDSYDALSR